MKEAKGFALALTGAVALWAIGWMLFRPGGYPRTWGEADIRVIAREEAFGIWCQTEHPGAKVEKFGDVRRCSEPAERRPEP